MLNWLGLVSEYMVFVKSSLRVYEIIEWWNWLRTEMCVCLLIFTFGVGCAKEHGVCAKCCCSRKQIVGRLSFSHMMEDSVFVCIYKNMSKVFKKVCDRNVSFQVHAAAIVTILATFVFNFPQCCKDTVTPIWNLELKFYAKWASVSTSDHSKGKDESAFDVWFCFL